MRIRADGVDAGGFCTAARSAAAPVGVTRAGRRASRGGVGGESDGS